MFNQKKRNLFYLANSFSEKSGGRTQATFFRADMLKDLAEGTYILTFNLKLKYGQIIKNIRKKRNLSSEIKFLNIFEYYANEPLYPLDADREKVFFSERKGFTYKYIHEKNGYKVYQKSQQVYYLQLAKDNTVQYIDYFDSELRKIKRVTYDVHGNKRKESFYHIKKKQIVRTNFFTTKKRLFMSIDYDENTKDSICCIVFDHKGNIKYTFENEKAMREHWLAKLSQEYNNSIFFVEDRKLDEVVAYNRYNDKLVSVPVIHSSHLKKPYKFGSPVNDFNGMLLNRISKHSAVVILTNEQLKHIHNQFGVYENMFHIPHLVDPTKVCSNDVKKDINKIVVISRFIEIKRIIDILQAFKLLYEKLPTAKMELWGTGEEEQTYKNFIEENNLSKAVDIKGYTDKPNEVFFSGGISIITSKYEGFGMTILESMSNSTPVIAYDFNYGPRELIDNNVNGFIVPDGDIKELANKMNDLLSNPELIKQFSIQAKKKAGYFNMTSNKEKWLELIKYVENKRKLDSEVTFNNKVLLSSIDKYNIEKVINGNEEEFHVSIFIYNLISPGNIKNKYYVYVKNYFELDNIGNRYVEAVISDSNIESEILKARFIFKRDEFERLKDRDLNFMLGISDGKHFSFVDINKVITLN